MKVYLQYFNYNESKKICFCFQIVVRYHFDFFFFKGRSYDLCIFFISPMHHYPPWNPTCVGNKPEENLFTLVEMEIQYQYTHIKSKILSLCQFLVFIVLQFNCVQNSFVLNTIDSHSLHCSTLGIVLQEQIG